MRSSRMYMKFLCMYTVVIKFQVIICHHLQHRLSQFTCEWECHSFESSGCITHLFRSMRISARTVFCWPCNAEQRLFPDTSEAAIRNSRPKGMIRCVQLTVWCLKEHIRLVLNNVWLGPTTINSEILGRVKAEKWNVKLGKILH